MKLKEDIETIRVDDNGTPIGIETLPAGTELINWGNYNYPKCIKVDDKDVWRFHLCVAAGEETKHYVTFTRPAIVLSEDEIKSMAKNSLGGYPTNALLAFFIHEKWEALIRETFG